MAKGAKKPVMPKPKTPLSKNLSKIGLNNVLALASLVILLVGLVTSYLLATRREKLELRLKAGTRPQTTEIEQVEDGIFMRGLIGGDQLEIDLFTPDQKKLMQQEQQKLLRAEQLKTTAIVPFTLETPGPGDYYIQGRGKYIYAGHGVGLSQWGAYGMGERGMSNDEILTLYFNGITLRGGNEDRIIPVEDHGNMNIETYVAGLGEIPDKACGTQQQVDENPDKYILDNPDTVWDCWPEETIKAQVIAARTYALHYTNCELDNPPDPPICSGPPICLSTSCQVYKGGLNKQWAASETAGVAMTYGSDYSYAFYHASSRGMTENNEFVFATGGQVGYPVAYLRAFNDSSYFTYKSYWHDWQWQTSGFTPQEFSDLVNGVVYYLKNNSEYYSHLPESIGELTSITTEEGASPRVKFVIFSGDAITEEVYINGRDFKSAYNSIVQTEDGFIESVEFTIEQNPSTSPSPTPSPSPSPTPISYPDWKGEYYTNQYLSGSPTLTRNDTQLNFDWSYGSPHSSIPSDHFSARWTKTYNFSSGNYIFKIKTDDGMKVWVDNTLVLDKWYDQAPTNHQSSPIYLTSGNHTIKVEWYENGGLAVAQAWWEEQTTTPSPTPSPSPTPTPISYPDWKGEYYNNKHLSGSPVLTRNDTSVNFDWGYGSPGSGVSKDQFSARWTKTYNFSSGNYIFKIKTDDGMKVWVDNTLVLDKWYDQAPTNHQSSPIYLTSGNHTIKVEWYENGGLAVAQAWWEEQTSTPTPTSTIYDDWKGEYYTNQYLSGSPTLIRNDASINFNWGHGSPYTSIPSDHFSARWTKTHSFNAGTYKFHIETDDGIRIWVDDVLELDKWFIQAPTDYTFTTSLTSGNHSIKVEWYENDGLAVAQMWWEKQ